jgi:hypothetical protein
MARMPGAVASAYTAVTLRAAPVSGGEYP